MSSSNWPDEMTLTSVVLPEFCKPTSVSSISYERGGGGGGGSGGSDDEDDDNDVAKALCVAVSFLRSKRNAR